jgi:hypothetical protein
LRSRACAAGCRGRQGCPFGSCACVLMPALPAGGAAVPQTHRVRCVPARTRKLRKQPKSVKFIPKQ